MAETKVFPAQIESKAGSVELTFELAAPLATGEEVLAEPSTGSRLVKTSSACDLNPQDATKVSCVFECKGVPGRQAINLHRVNAAGQKTRLPTAFVDIVAGAVKPGKMSRLLRLWIEDAEKTPPRQGQTRRVLAEFAEDVPPGAELQLKNADGGSSAKGVIMDDDKKRMRFEIPLEKMPMELIDTVNKEVLAKPSFPLGGPGFMVVARKTIEKPLTMKMVGVGALAILTGYLAFHFLVDTRQNQNAVIAGPKKIEDREDTFVVFNQTDRCGFLWVPLRDIPEFAVIRNPDTGKMLVKVIPESFRDLFIVPRDGAMVNIGKAVLVWPDAPPEIAALLRPLGPDSKHGRNDVKLGGSATYKGHVYRTLVD